MTDEIMRALGNIEGQLEGIKGQQTAQGKKLDKIDDRMRKVELKSAINGGITGSIAGIGVSLIVASLKEVIKTNGS